MKAVQSQPCHEFTHKMLTVESVCGISSQSESYWSFYVNDVKSQVGVFGYVVSDMDNLLMVYETPNNTTTIVNTGAANLAPSLIFYFLLVAFTGNLFM